MPRKKHTEEEETLKSAIEAEAEGDTPDAIEVYEKKIASGTLNPEPYNRLMVIYRKDKDYAAEMRVIKKGIAALMAKQEEQQKEALSKTKGRRKLHSLSMQLAKKLGAIDKKGLSNYLPEPLEKWMKRKEVVEKKLGNVKKNKVQSAAKKKTTRTRRRKTAAKH